MKKVRKNEFARNTKTGESVAMKVLDKPTILKNKMVNQIRLEGISSNKMGQFAAVLEFYKNVCSKLNHVIWKPSETLCKEYIFAYERVYSFEMKGMGKHFLDKGMCIRTEMWKDFAVDANCMVPVLELLRCACMKEYPQKIITCRQECDTKSFFC